MKNKLIALFLLLLIPFVVNAESCDNNKVRIKSISIENIEGRATEKKDASVEDKNINLDLSMSDVGDSITYKIEVENSSSEDYEIDNTNIKSKSRYIKYSFINNDSMTVGSGQTKVLYLMAKYDTEVPATALVNDTYIDTEDIVVNLSSYTNPKTGSNVMFIITMGLLLSVVVYFYFKQDYKIPTMIIILSLIIIPITAKAACKLSINIKSNVEITKIAEFDTGSIVNVKMRELSPGNSVVVFYSQQVNDILSQVPFADSIPKIGVKEPKVNVDGESGLGDNTLISTITVSSFKRSNTLPEDIKNIVNEQLNEVKSVTVSDEEVDGVFNHYNSQESLDNTITDAVIETINGKTEICNKETNECFQKEEIIEYLVHYIPFIKIVEYGSNEVKYVIYDETADDIKVVDTNEVKKELKEVMLLSKKVTVLKNVFSSDKSDYLIYGWFNEDDNTIYYYCEKDKVYLNKDAANMFVGAPRLEDFSGIESVDSSRTKYMNGMFRSAGRDTSSFSLDLSNWSTKNVVDMSSMFESAGYSSISFNLNLSGFNTSKVTSMNRMFSFAGENASNFNINGLSNFDTSKVTDMSSMFSFTGVKTTNFVLDLSRWNTSNVEYMGQMFYSSGGNSPKWSVGDLSNWNLSKTETIYKMFYKAGELATEWNSIGTLNIYGDDIEGMFADCKNAKATINLHKKIVNYDYIFDGAATKEGASIVVNYSSEVDNIDDVINTKSAESHVTKGELIN